MNEQYLYIFWILSILLSASIVLFCRYRAFGKAKLNLGEILDLSLSVLLIGSGLFLFYRILTQFKELFEILQQDGIVALTLGGITSLWFGVIKIRELAVKRPS